jgi:hypothetical protein
MDDGFNGTVEAKIVWQQGVRRSFLLFMKGLLPEEGDAR